MREYTAEKIRNVVILGHLGSGKTSLTESLLFRTGALKVKGEVEKKNTVSDHLPEEQSRPTSLTASLIPVESKDYNERNRIRKFLYATGIYGSLSELDGTLAKWLKDSEDE